MRKSAFRGTWQPNRRPYITLTPDAFVSLQGETTVIACGECRREVNYNNYITQISTEGSVDSPPGSASFTMSVPDNSLNDFYAEGQFIIIPMMEVEIFAKGYFTVGGVPQYYRVFWGLVQSVTRSWSNGVTTIQISCKDILRWWELTNAIMNPAFLNAFGGSAGKIQMFGNQFAGMNPYEIIIRLARESMGDFSFTTGSLNDNHQPEKGEQLPVIGSYAKDMMGYWQLKFANIWSSLVLYGTSGSAYSFSNEASTKNSNGLTKQIIEQESDIEKKEGAATGAVNQKVTKTRLSDLAAFKTEISRAGAVEMFETETQSKLSIAMTARDQAGYEFYCDTTGDIVFKPPFYNLNVLPNKPVSWIQDFEILDDSVTDSELEVYTHITSSGNAFSGNSTDYGLNDPITTPRTGVYDFHLLRRYGWRRLDYQCEWASDAKKLFFQLIDHLDKVNSKRQNGSITIPMRPELRMGFPIWIPKYDSFFYIQGISHAFSVGGQATTTLTLTAKRSKFIAPKAIGTIIESTNAKSTNSNTGAKNKKDTPDQKSYIISFPQDEGTSTGIITGGHPEQGKKYGEPQILRDPKTGKLLGFPNAVMVFQKPWDGDKYAKIESLNQLGKSRNTSSESVIKQGNIEAGRAPNKKGEGYDYKDTNATNNLNDGQRLSELVSRLRAHRYEAGMTNAGAYDYAHDVNRVFRELTLIPIDLVTHASSNTGFGVGPAFEAAKEEEKKQLAKDIAAQENALAALQLLAKSANNEVETVQGGKDKKNKPKVKGAELDKYNLRVQEAKAKAAPINEAYDNGKKELNELKKRKAGSKKIPSLNMLIRPVSDEFGFEVIGHHRYGRGAFIDRGKIQVTDPKNDSVSNKIGIQFASTGGFLTDSQNSNVAAGHESVSFSEAFEDMRPEDYETGASFDHGVQEKGEIQNISITSRQTYDSAISSSASRLGTTVYTDADATNRGQLLSELKPTMSTGLSDINAVEKCGCGIGRTEWLSFLPQESLNQILRPLNTSSAVSTQQSLNFVNFFDVLNDYLVQRFEGDYQINSDRERDDIGETFGAYDPDNQGEETNLLGDPQNPLFNAASNGNVDALQALQKEANFNFGSSEEVTKNAGKDIKRASDATKASILALPGQIAAQAKANKESYRSGGLSISISPTQQQADAAQRDLEIAKVTLRQAEQFAKDNPNSGYAKQNLADAQQAYSTAKGAAATASDENDRSAAVNSALESVNKAQSEVSRLEALIALSPDDESLRLKLQKAKTNLSSAQNNLNHAQNDSVNVDPKPIYQPLAPPPTQSGILNPSQFGGAYGTYRSGDPFPRGP